MAADWTIERDGDEFYLRGRLDERSDLAPLFAHAGPMRLNLQWLSGMNAEGAKAFAAFMKQRGERPLTFVECPRWFVDQANVMPALLGGASRGDRIESLYVPFACSDCKTRQDMLTTAAQVRVTHRGVQKVPSPRCESCGKGMEPAVDCDDFFLFLVEARKIA